AFRPFLWLPGPPSIALVAGRVAMASSTLVCAIAAAWLARRAGGLPRDCVLAGILTLVWIANAGEGIVLRPEQIATTLTLLGIAALVVPRERGRAGPG